MGRAGLRRVDPVGRVVVGLVDVAKGPAGDPLATGRHAMVTDARNGISGALKSERKSPARVAGRGLMRAGSKFGYT